MGNNSYLAMIRSKTEPVMAGNLVGKFLVLKVSNFESYAKSS